ncbi:MAG: penicillin acylase family protein [Gammaproteobacteria bacterium]
MKRIILGAVSVAIVAAIAALLAAVVFLRGSAPQLDGTVKLAGLSAPVMVTRDALGVPTITAANADDMARVLGFLHAQDRFFQMDLLRRLAGGELAALVGPAAVKVDEEHRLFRLRAVAEQVLARDTPGQRALLRAYAEGVNAGLATLKARPFEYALLRQRPQPWRPEDSVMVLFAMYFDLQDAFDRRAAELGAMRESLPKPLFDFLNAPGTQWDAPLSGVTLPVAPIPDASAVNIRDWPAADFAGLAAAPPQSRMLAGSNSFAVDAAHSADGHAILANDMHLPLAVPNIWYRARLLYRTAAATRVDVTGVTLPGLPGVVVGSNGHIAWGFTNSYGNWTTLVNLHLRPGDPGDYHTASGWQPFTLHKEIIHVAHGRDVLLQVRDTIWGPLIGKSPKGVWRAVHWIADDPAATNDELLDLATAQNVAGAMAVANRAGIPAQNFLVVDSAGNIAWTIAGRIPVRSGYDPELPAYWDQPGVGWNGWLAPEEYPRVVDPPAGRLWTANNRVVGGSMLAQIGNGGYDLGARARQIRDDLAAHSRFTPKDMLAIELDDRAVFLGRWQRLLLTLLTPATLAKQPRRAQFRYYVVHWGGRAAIDSVGYRLVRDFHADVDQTVFAALTAPCRKRDPRCRYTVFGQREGPLWALVTRQPLNLLPPQYRSWNELLLASVDRVIADLWQPGAGLAERTWGAHNTVRLQQPLSGALPVLGRWLDMQPVELPGDNNMPRVQGVSFGASERMDVEPGDEAKGIFEMPAGESGYPLSPFYRNSQSAWERGAASAFLPGPSRYRLTFEPAG